MISKNGYSHLPTNEPQPPSPSNYTSFTVKSDGRMRFCKKCQAAKPDRAHHCSTCGRCVLKMDHHCPWLATCVGLRNYKAFLLFLFYICFFCWLCFAVSASWVWSNILSGQRYKHSIMPINYILLAVISGIFGLVLTGFTLWHIWLASSGMTTIEKLEKTRYLTPVRQAMQRQIQRQQDKQQASIYDQLREIHANTLPGVTRPEEGEDGTSVSPAHQSLRETYESMEIRRERERYDSYLDDVYSERLPNAFDLGRWQNLLYIFGNRPLLWFVPICNSLGDGWQWEPNPNWIAAQSQLARERDQQQQRQQHQQYGYYHGQGYNPHLGSPAERSPTSQGRARYAASQNYAEPDNATSSDQDRELIPQPESAMLGRSPSIYSESNATRLNNLRPSHMKDNSTIDRSKLSTYTNNDDVNNNTPANWNDIPNEMLNNDMHSNSAASPHDNYNDSSSSSRRSSRSKSKNRRPMDSTADGNANMSTKVERQNRQNKKDDEWDEWAPQ